MKATWDPSYMNYAFGSFPYYGWGGTGPQCCLVITAIPLLFTAALCYWVFGVRKFNGPFVSCSPMNVINISLG